MLDWEAIQDRLAAYARDLAEAADDTTSAADRPRYQAHLAAAARMYTTARLARALPELRQLVEAERHSFGWGFLAHDCGGRAEASFAELAAFVDGLDDEGS